MIRRDLYLRQITPFIDRPLIKVLSGLRRSGKSALLQQLKELLLDRGVNAANIIHINFENMAYSAIDNADKLYDYLMKCIVGAEKMYILLDEIQEVRGWEKAVNSFFSEGRADLYVTGSNSRLLSSELATYIAGRYVEFNVYTLSFQEYLQFVETRTGEKIADLRLALDNYIKYGGFPAIHNFDYSQEEVYKIVSDIYASAILRDVVQRNNIRDVALLEKIVKFIFDNIGNIFSAKKISDYFKSQQRKGDIGTIYNYLDALERAFIIHKAQRYDLKGKELLQTNEKYFIGDVALKYSAVGYREMDISGLIENIIYLELKRRGYIVYVGKFSDREIDFVAEKRNDKIYIQAVFRLSSEEVIDREFKPLLLIEDNYPKYVVTLDDTWKGSYEGVHHYHLADFLLSDEY